MAGRPKKYRTKKALTEAIDRYFSSISRTVTVRDNIGQVVYNDDGQPITRTQYICPPTVSAMCLAIGIDRRTWNNYCDAKQHPEFRSVTERTRARIEAYLEEELLVREKNVQGIIFNLQNNYGWKNRQEVGLDKPTRETARETLSVYDKMAAIAAAQAELPELAEHEDEDD